MMEMRDVLQQVKDGALSIEDAEQFFRRAPFEELGYAKLDIHRKWRSGFSEVVFCSGKTDEHLISIFERLVDVYGEVLGTRATPHQYEVVKKFFPAARYDSLAHLLVIEQKDKVKCGYIVVCTAGTADIPVAEEAAQTAEFFGAYVERIYDVGVSGLHRLLSHLDNIQSAYCVIAVAGMEGALASVLGGLVQNPVIAVPTSVGYGASFGGVSALLTMLNSCANGVATVNIDNGYGAGYLAVQINRLALNAGERGEGCGK
jgi:phosphoribosylcarboxyaminoimidazole (NCAIR) mutase